MSSACAKGETKLLAVNFENVADATAIKVVDLIKAEGGFVGAANENNADQIWTYSQSEGWNKYYYYKTARAPIVEYWAVCGGKTEVTEADTIDAGAGFFFVRSSSSSSTACALTFKGPDYKGE